MKVLQFILLMIPGLSACTFTGPERSSPSGRESPIVGGSNQKGDPAVALLRFRRPGADRPNHCTATLVAPDVLLTAAHCVSHPPQTVYEAFFGEDMNGPGRWVSIK